MSKIQPLPVAEIRLRPDARQPDPAAVEALAESVVSVGLINPIRVRPVEGGWEVIAGGHRLGAHKSLGLVEIDCVIVEDDDLHAELAMIDENLCRAELSPSDRAAQTARRKAIYLELHPETGHGKASPAKDEKFASFAGETAARTGQSERLVQLNAERGQKILPEVLDLIRGTKLDTGAYMDKLKKLPGSEQYQAAKRDLAFDRKQERKARQAEFDRQREATQAALPDAIKELQARRDDAREQKAEASIDRLAGLEAENAEQRQYIATLETDLAEANAKLAKYDDMVVEYERGGFEEVIKGRDEQIRVLRRQVERESQEKVKNLRSADYWKKKALEFGANDDVVIDMATGEMSRG